MYTKRAGVALPDSSFVECVLTTTSSYSGDASGPVIIIIPNTHKRALIAKLNLILNLMSYNYVCKKIM